MAINLGTIFFGLAANTASLSAATAQVNAFTAAVNAATANVNKFNQNTKNINSGAADALQRLGNVAVLLNGPLGGVSARLNVLASVARNVGIETALAVTGIAAGIFVFTKLGEAAVSAASQMQKITLALDAINQNSQTTSLELNYLLDLSNRTGQGFAEISKQYAQLKAASQGSNLEGEKTRTIFEEITFSAAKLGLSTTQTGDALLAIQQIMSKGKLQGQELTQQLGNNLPGAAVKFAQSLGITVGQMYKLMQQGKVTSDALVGFAKLYAQSLGVDVNGSINTIASAQGRLTNAFLEFNLAVDKSVGFSKAYTSTLNALAGALDFLAGHMGTILTLAGSVAIGLAAMFAPTIIVAVFKFIDAIKGASIVLGIFNGVVAANPIGGMLTLLTRLIFLVGGTYLGFQLLNGAFQNAGDTATGLATQIWNNSSALKDINSQSAAFQTNLRTQIQLEIETARASLEAAGALYQQALATQAARDAAGPGQQRADNILDSIFGKTAPKDQAKDALVQVNSYRDALSALQAQLKALGNLGTTAGAGGNDKGLSSGQTKAIREAREEIERTSQAYSVLLQTPTNQQLLTYQDQLNKSIQEFHDHLVDAKVPAQEVSALTAQFAHNAKQLADEKYDLAVFPDIFKQLANTLGSSLDSGMSAFIDDISQGKDALQSLKDIGRQVALDLIKTFATLAVLNPIKNLLGADNGGGAFPSFNFGGIISSLFSGASSVGGPAAGNFSIGGLSQYAGGGGFTVGGNNGGVDSQLVQFMATRGEHVNISNAQGGSSNTGGSGGVFHAIIDLTGANGDAAIEAATQRGITAAFELFNKSNTQRAAIASINGKLNRVPGLG